MADENVQGNASKAEPSTTEVNKSTKVDKTPQSPNDNWKNDSRLDANGNPVIETKTKDVKPDKDVKSTTPEVTGDKGGDQESGGDSNTNDKAQENKEASKVDFSAPVVKQVESLIVDAGLNAADVAKAVTEGEGKVTPAIMKALVDKHGEAVASIIADNLSNFHSANKAKASKRDEEVYNTVKDAFKDVTDQSGQETWKELSGWAKDNIPNSERSEINKLLAQGGIAAKYAIQDLVSRFKSSDSFTQQADLLTGDNTAKDYGVTPLSKSDYQREFRALEAKGHIYGQSAELDKLDKRRTAGIRRGI